MFIRVFKNGSVATAALLAFILVALFIRQVSSVSDSQAGYQTARLLTFLSSFPDLNELSRNKNALTLILGQSELETSFDPQIFDSLLAKSGTPTDTYNLGIRFLSPELFSVFAKIYRDRRGPRARFIFYNLPLFSLSSGYARSMGVQLGHLPLLQEWAKSASPSELASELFLSSVRSAFTIQAAEGGAILKLPMAGVFSHREKRKRLFDDYVDFWSDPVHADTSPWRKDSRGLYQFRMSPEETSYYERKFQNPAMRQAIAAAYEACCNLLTLDISPSRLEALVRTNADLLEIGEQVVFLDLKESPGFQLFRHPGALARREKAKAFLREKGLVIWEVDAGLTDDDYTDGIHLSPSGADKLHHWLAGRVKAQLASVFPEKAF